MVDSEFVQRLIVQCQLYSQIRRMFQEQPFAWARGGNFDYTSTERRGTVVTGAVHRIRFVLLSLFCFLLLSVSQLVKTAAALGCTPNDSASRDKGFICEAAGVHCGRTRRNRSFVPSLFPHPIPSVHACISFEETIYLYLPLPLVLSSLPRMMHLLSRKRDAVPLNRPKLRRKILKMYTRLITKKNPFVDTTF